MGRIAKPLSLLTLSLAVAVAIVETGLRLAEYDPNPAPQWRYHSLLGWTMDPGRIQADQINPDGFRYRKEPTSGRADDSVKTLVVLGDSFTAALDLPYAETFPGQLERLLNEFSDNDTWRVISLSCDDWGNTQELLALEELGFDFEPHAVVLQSFPLNDFCNNSMILARTCSLQDDHRPYFVLDGDQLRLTHLQPVRASLRRLRSFAFVENRLTLPPGRLPASWMPDQPDQDLRRRSYFEAQAGLNGLEHEGFIYSLLPEPHQPAPIRRAWETSRKILERTAGAVTSRGIPLIGLVIPFSKTFRDTWHEVEALSSAPMEREYATRRYERFLLQAGARVVSVRSRIEAGTRPSGDYFISPTDGHLSRFGHAECARWVFEALGVEPQ